jgi:hypothetical protein
MNRLDRTRARYFVPAGLKRQIPTSTFASAATLACPEADGRRVPNRPDSSAPSPSVPGSTTPTSAPPSSVPTSTFKPPTSAPRTHRIADPTPASIPDKGIDPEGTRRARSSTSSTSSTSFTPCTYRSSDGRRCRMIRSKEHAEFCAHHAQQELRALERSVAQPLAREILGDLTDMRSGAAVNHAMANLFILSADGRVSSSRTASLAYLSQLLLQSLSAMKQDWRGDKPPSIKQALAAELIETLPSADEEESDAADNDS